MIISPKGNDCEDGDVEKWMGIVPQSKAAREILLASELKNGEFKRGYELHRTICRSRRPGIGN